MGKMKKWRREASFHNKEAGEKHQGRKNKSGSLIWPAYALMSPGLVQMFLNAGLPAGMGEA